MVTGNITLTSISDQGLILIIEARDAKPGLTISQGQLGGSSGNASATIGWKDAAGIKAAAELLNRLADQP